MGILPHQTTTQRSFPEPPELVRRVIRTQLDAVVIGGIQDRTVHIPAAKGSDEKACTVAYGTETGGRKKNKPVDTFPPGYYDWCRRCAAGYIEGAIDLPKQ